MVGRGGKVVMGWGGVEWEKQGWEKWDGRNGVGWGEGAVYVPGNQSGRGNN